VHELSARTRRTRVDRFLTIHLRTIYTSVFTDRLFNAYISAGGTKQMKNGLLSKVLMTGAVVTLVVASAASASTTPAPANDAEIAKRLTHEVRMYSRYTIFDNVNFRVQEGNVELLGEVSQPFKKADLARVAKSVPGVTSVTNSLKVLPLSSM